MSAIHPTALVAASAQLGVGVRIGPYAVIEAEAVVGDDCEIEAHAIIAAGTRLGARNRIGYGSILGAAPQIVGWQPVPSWVEFGTDNIVREYVTIHRASRAEGVTRVGDGNFLMTGVHVGHDGVIGNRAILANNTLLAGHVAIGDGAFLGGATLLHQNVRVGTLAITRGGTRLGKDVPPYFMAVETNQVAGLNRVGLRRAGIAAPTIRALQSAYDLLYAAGLNVTQALARLRELETSPELTALIEFISTSKRGICGPRSSSSEP